MNKLASLAIVVFLILGGLMWYAANGSMQQYLVQYQQEINQQLPRGSHFALRDIQLMNANNQGSLFDIDLTIPVTEKDSATIKINEINWQYEKRSLKKGNVVVEYVNLPSVEFIIPINQPRVALAKFSADIDTLVGQAMSNKLGLNGRQEFNVNIQKLVIENLYIKLQDNKTPIEEIIVNKLSLSPEQLKENNPMSITGAKLIQILTMHASETLVSYGK
ncbi:hypothetical protein HII17_04905 [Thalassotalea sp. M1531]|uniref:Uncharacterized protein n=1 Tax=Thalassotalea algicola TaxID=2716224 RepID=A0A7Y0LAK7_9GAMM|nr:hypothetical protein [Thalassotalea algicola]NMP30896.1 hypothetical protein [Thalassotalea algicola]